MAMTIEQQRAIALARARRRRQEQGAAPEPKSVDTLAPVEEGFLGSIGNRLYDAANALGLPASRMRRDLQGVNTAVRGAADTATFGTSDEIAAGLGALTGVGGQKGNYAGNLELQRAIDEQAQANNPGARITGQLMGGLATGALAAPYTLSTRFAASTLGPRAMAGIADGAMAGAAYGAGSGEGAGGRARGAAVGAGVGGAAGGAFPLVAAGASRGYQAFQNARNVAPVAERAGASPDTLRLLGNVIDSDGSLGPRGRANMASAGREAMLADAGPTARSVLDTAIQRGGPGAIMARDRIAGRVGRDAQALTGALDQSLGTPQGVTAARTSIREGSQAARSTAYNRAYSQPIDYSSQEGLRLERMIRNRVPASVIQRANALMRVNGDQSKQILARVADDGSVTFERLPDVRQIDYITRALNDLADAGEGAGALGGQNQLGRSYQNLSREIRRELRTAVPSYGEALETAADPIRRSQAVKLGSRIASMPRDEVAEAVEGMTKPEREALLQGFRSRLDDQMARVTRAVTDGDMEAREAIKGLKDLSSRQARTNLRQVMGDEADRLFDEIDRITKSFELRASVADNSKTYARQETNRRVGDMAAPGVIGTAARGEPINAGQRMIQALTGQTDDVLRERQDAVFSEIADLLTRPGGAGQRVYDAAANIGRTDAVTQGRMALINALLSGPRLSYPSAVLADRTLLQ